MTHNPVEALREALKIADRALWIHAFVPRGHDTANDRDTCQQCGRNFRHEHHLRLTEGAPSDVIAEASRIARAALSSPAPAGGEGIKPHHFVPGPLTTSMCKVCGTPEHGHEKWAPPPSPDVAGVVERMDALIADMMADPHEIYRVFVEARAAIESISAEKGRLEARLDAGLLCEVTVAPATRFSEGVKISTVLAAIERRALTPKDGSR